MGNLIFAILALAMGAAGGMYFSAEVRKREFFLRKMLLFCGELKIDVRCRAAAVGEIVRKAKESKPGDAFFSALEEGAGFHESWVGAVKKETSLTGADRDVLINLGNELGRSDAGGQEAVIRLTEELLKNQLEDAEKQSEKKAPMYRSVGFLCGIAAAVVII